MHSDWFFLGLDFAISSVFFFSPKSGKFKLCNQNYEKKTCECSQLRKKIPKRLIFHRAYNKNEEDEYSRSKFYYSEDLEKSNVKTFAVHLH